MIKKTQLYNRNDVKGEGIQIMTERIQKDIKEDTEDAATV